MAFKPFIKPTTRAGLPMITISSSGLISFNPTCVQENNLDSSVAISCEYDEVTSLLKITLENEEGPNTLKLSHKAGKASTCSGKTMLKFFGIFDGHTCQYDADVDKSGSFFEIRIGGGKNVVRSPRSKKTALPPGSTNPS